jgi:hypothetical protein
VLETVAGRLLNSLDPESHLEIAIDGRRADRGPRTRRSAALQCYEITCGPVFETPTNYDGLSERNLCRRVIDYRTSRCFLRICPGKHKGEYAGAHGSGTHEAPGARKGEWMARHRVSFFSRIASDPVTAPRMGVAGPSGPAAARSLGLDRTRHYSVRGPYGTETETL